MKEPVIKVEGVYKDFTLPHQRAGSVKGVFTSMFRKVTNTKEKQHALKDISFEINKGEFFGIVGRNGSGKSTMLKILAGIYQPTKGSIYTTGKLVPFIELGVGFNPELTGRDNVYLNGAILGFSTKEIERMYEDIVEFAELERFMDQKLKNYSSGMQVRLAFSMAIRANADILLIDEVLAVGDADFQRKCFNYFKSLKKNNTTVVFVSHDMNSVREYCDRALLIENSKAVILDTADRVAKEYSRMFIDSSKTEHVSKETKRWGTSRVSFTKVEQNNKTLPNGQYVEVICEAIAKEDLDDVIFGFVIKNASGQSLMGTNSQVEEKNVTAMKKDKLVRVIWRIPDIFTDGYYTVDPAIILSNGEICDWWEEAAKFEVKKENHITYMVYPRVDLTIESYDDVV